MSDYYREGGHAWASLPLFKAGPAAIAARKFHESDAAQAGVLKLLREGEKLTKQYYEQGVADGSRLAPVIEQLRNAHGFTINGRGTIDNPYFMPDLTQRPSMARVTPEMKSAYYTTPHWFNVRVRRLMFDGGWCVICHRTDELQCHHVTYDRIFNEPNTDLATVCVQCHEKIHKHCGLKFPSGVSVQYAAHLGWKGFEAWLL